MNQCLEIRCQIIVDLATKTGGPQVPRSFDNVVIKGKAPWAASVNPRLVHILYFCQVIEQCHVGQSIKLKPLQLAGIVL